MDLKELLYFKINQLGINFIKSKINDNMQNSEYIIEQILEECARVSGSHNLTSSDYISLAESLLHYLLTITITPSQRKININNTEVSILVPNARNLKNGGDKVIIIQFLKEDKVLYEQTVNALLKIQPTFGNIWFVSYCPIVSRLPLKNFVISGESIGTEERVLPFSKLMIEIDNFLKQINYTGFRIL